VPHLHGLQLDDHLAGRDAIALADAHRRDRAGHRRDQRARRELRVRVGEPRHRTQAHRAERRVDAHQVVAVRRHVERVPHPVDLQADRCAVPVVEDVEFPH
jgi:hypothetical protein